jgi:hypothetical protein
LAADTAGSTSPVLPQAHRQREKRGLLEQFTTGDGWCSSSRSARVLMFIDLPLHQVMLIF